MPQIVTVNVNQIQAPTPPTLQKTGAIISQGGTILTPGSSALLTLLQDLTPLLNGSHALTSITYSTGLVTATAAAPHGLPVGQNIEITIAGSTPAGYNGTFLATITSTTAFTYPLALAPGANTVLPGYTLEDVAELTQMATTHFGMGAQQAAYVLELGAVSDDAAIAALSAYITANPNILYVSGAAGFYYAYLVPRSWDGNANFLNLIAQFENTTGRTYFFITTKLSTRALYTNVMKDVVALIEAPKYGTWASKVISAATWAAGVATFTTASAHGVAVGDWFQIQGMAPVAWNGWYQAVLGTTGSTLLAAKVPDPGAQTTLGTLVASTFASAGTGALEFSAAAPFWKALSYDPSSTNKVGPFAFSYMPGVTPFPRRGNLALLAALKAESINYIMDGAEGGVTSNILEWGTTKDGRDFTYWYSVDWAAINIDINLANTIINGSNNPVNPLYYSQDGIDRLQDAAVATMNSAISVGLANGSVKRTTMNGSDFIKAIDSGDLAGYIVVNAVPYRDYLRVNPGDYKIGKYSGLSAQYIPNRGFIEIIFNLNVTDFVTQ